MFGKTGPVCKSTLETAEDYLQFIIMTVVIAASPTAGSKEPAVTYVSELLWSFPSRDSLGITLLMPSPVKGKEQGGLGQLYHLRSELY